MAIRQVPHHHSFILLLFISSFCNRLPDSGATSLRYFSLLLWYCKLHLLLTCYKSDLGGAEGDLSHPTYEPPGNLQIGIKEQVDATK